MTEAEAGAGKSSLLDLAVDSALEREKLVLTARAGEYARELAYAVIRQLFEPRFAQRSDDGNQLSGAAALAAGMFDVRSEPVGADRLAIRHGPCWLTADVAAERPLALLVDDAHRADAASLRALLQLAPRLDGLLVALLAAARTGEPDVRDELLDGLCPEPGAPTAHLWSAERPSGRRARPAAARHRGLGAVPRPVTTPPPAIGSC
jgi:hypothetical protein